MSAGREPARSEKDDILVVDDQPANLAVLAQLLSEEGYKVRAVTSGERALEAASKAVPTCILLDVSMPGMDGFDTCAAFRRDPRLAEVPVIFLTAHDDVAHKVKAFAVGGSDHIGKPFQAEEVLARVRHQVRTAHLDRTLRARNAELEEAVARLHVAYEDRSRIVAMLVHDLRSPLTIVGARVAGDTHPDTVADAEEAYRRIIRLIDDLLAHARSEHAREDVAPAGSLDLVELAGRSFRLARTAALAKGIALGLRTPPGPVAIVGKSLLLDRAMSNLLDNAIKFTPCGGEVTLALSTEEGAGVESGLRFASMRVCDTGPGIAAGDLPFVFDPYKQAEAGRAHGGYGLGLAIVARVVAEHGGRVRVMSQLGIGTEFQVLLPLSQA